MWKTIAVHAIRAVTLVASIARNFVGKASFYRGQAREADDTIRSFETLLTRRSMQRLWGKTWFSLFLVPWKSHAQPNCNPALCPNTYIDCYFLGGQSSCNSSGVFILRVCNRRRSKSIRRRMCVVR